MTDPGGGQADLRPHLRSETIDEHATVIVRGGPNRVLTLQRHARRTAQAFALDGVPVWGISVMAALDDLGPASLPGILAGRMATYPVVHVPTASALLEAGIELLPTFGRPHFTARIGSDDEPDLAGLLAALGPAQANPYHGGRRSRRR